MKNQFGITLISLVITIILIIILASVVISTGLDAYENMRVEAFVAKMKTVQEAVDKLCVEYTVQEINESDSGSRPIGLPASSAPSDAQVILETVIEEGAAGNLKSWFKSAGDEGKVNYRYFSINDISTILGIKDFDTAIFFNPRTKNVIAVDGVKYDGKKYYRQYDLSSGQTLQEPNTDTDFNLGVTVKTFDNKAVIYINTDKKITELKYQKKNSAGNYGDLVNSLDLDKITISESGIYRVEAKTVSAAETSGIVTKTCEDINVVIVNKPMLVNGMTPIKYGTDSSEIVTTVNDEDWYNYGEQRWANVRLLDGSVFVWIPRYAYSIQYNNDENISEGGSINVEFMKGISSLITTSENALNSSFKVMPAFKDGSTTGFSNGEWDSELYGIWVAKYEPTSQTIGEDNYPKIVATNVDCWTNISPKEAFNICRKMENIDFGTNNETYFSKNVTKASGNLNYGVYDTDTNNIDTHLMKNSEWGAVAYLSYSKYGNEGQILSGAGDYKSSNWLADVYSTTGNIYGIFGMSGGAYDEVSGGVKIDGNFNSENKSTKYATVYPTDKSENKIIYGDGIRETEGWGGCSGQYPAITANNNPYFFVRGGNKTETSTSKIGVFSYIEKIEIGTTTVSFRPVLIVEY